MRLLTADQLAAAIGLEVSFIQRTSRKESYIRIPAFQLGGLLVYNEKEVRDWLEHLKTVGTNKGRYPVVGRSDHGGDGENAAANSEGEVQAGL